MCAKGRYPYRIHSCPFSIEMFDPSELEMVAVVMFSLVRTTPLGLPA